MKSNALLYVIEADGNVRFHIGSQEKMVKLGYDYLRTSVSLISQCYNVWRKHMNKLQAYLSLTENFTSIDLDILRDVEDHLVNDFWKSSKSGTIDSLSKARSETRKLADILERNARRPSGPLSIRDPYYSSLPTIPELKKTLGSFDLVLRLYKKHCPEFLHIMNLACDEEKPYRETNRKIRLLLGPQDEINGTRIKTSDVRVLYEKMKNLRV